MYGECYVILFKLFDGEVIIKDFLLKNNIKFIIDVLVVINIGGFVDVIIFGCIFFYNFVKNKVVICFFFYLIVGILIMVKSVICG